MDQEVSTGNPGQGRGDAAAAFDAAIRGPGGPVPYRDEMESFFGVDLGGVRAYLGAAMGLLDADAAASGDAIAFSETRPDKQQVVEEVAHYLQQHGGSGGGEPGPGTTSPNEAAEREAKGARARFGAGQQAPPLTESPSGVARDEGGTPLAQLRTAAAGNWIGDVDEGECLRLINALTPADKTTVCGDTALMQQLADALDETEIVTAVNALGFELKWKAYWIDRAGETSSVPALTWQALIGTAPRQQVLEFIGWSDLFQRCYPYFGVTPLVLFSSYRAGPDWGAMLASSQALVRWLCDTTPAVTVIDEVGGPTVADANVAGIVSNLQATGKWAGVLAALPRGSGLNAVTRAAMRKIAGQVGITEASELFRIRFNTTLEGRSEDAAGAEVAAGTAGATAITWVVEDLRVVWDQLDLLPDQDVSDNTVIRAWQAISGDQGFYSGPNPEPGVDLTGTGTIKLGQGLRNSQFFQSGDARNNTMPNPDRMPHTVRHEVGHAVHRQLGTVVNAWLQNGVGFWFMPGGTAGLRTLVTDLGGFPAQYEDLSANMISFSDTDQQRVLDLLEAHGGSNRWSGLTALPDPASVTPTAGFAGPASPAQQDALLWRAMPAAVRDCFRLSSPNWFVNYATLPAGPKGRYFYNHWYHQPFYFSNVALSAVNATGDNYTAMSHKEFFANCYAEYFKEPAGYTDHSLWGGSLSADVKSFFTTHVLERQPYAPPVGGGAGANLPTPPTGGDPGTP